MPLILTEAFRHIWKKIITLLAVDMMQGAMQCFPSWPLSLNTNNQQLWLHERVQNRTSSPPQDARLLGCVPSRHHVFHAWKRANEKWARETWIVFQQLNLSALHTWDKEPTLCSLVGLPASLRSVCTTVYYPCCVGETTRDFTFHHISTTDHFSSLQAMVGGVRWIKSQSGALMTVTSLLRSALE